MQYTLLTGDAIEQLQTLPDCSVNTCVTSPPYYGLRDYETGTWIGGDPNCPHYRISKRSDITLKEVYKRMYECFHCGEKAVIRDGDFSFDDYGEEGEGIIHECHCELCGARITYQIPIDKEDD